MSLNILVVGSTAISCQLHHYANTAYSINHPFLTNLRTVERVLSCCSQFLPWIQSYFGILHPMPSIRFPTHVPAPHLVFLTALKSKCSPHHPTIAHLLSDFLRVYFSTWISGNFSNQISKHTILLIHLGSTRSTRQTLHLHIKVYICSP